VKFLPMTSGGSSVAACKHCSLQLSSFMSMCEMQAPIPPPPAPAPQPMDAEQSLSQTSFSQSQSFSLPQSSVAAQLPAVAAPTGQSNRSSSVGSRNGKRMAVSEMAKVSQ
jgi:hypothetical protein